MKASDVYDELAKIYASPYPDKAEERKIALKFLKQSFQDDPTMVERLKPKLEQLMQRQKNMKGKFCGVIMDKYWDKIFVRDIRVRRFDDEQI